MYLLYFSLLINLGEIIYSSCRFFLPKQMVTNMTLAWRLNFPSQLGNWAELLGENIMWKLRSQKTPLMPPLAPGYTSATVLKYL